ncbi:hypothetical protein FB45DRAFT_941556 [Roridomyces roridus]|uniref:Uncharacterized protein n=1 Tax=Roridomyces roridus TaxID=1738132 RepID=A0AAD7AZZ3_9AGAR|nr:hypothetical protein FB45DRAFT_951638 [Roridomyces roridus]KAJ7611330.1 hypothetical protein FB45DRAFT_941556 [Roridomyces roridus]
MSTTTTMMMPATKLTTTAPPRPSMSSTSTHSGTTSSTTMNFKTASGAQNAAPPSPLPTPTTRVRFDAECVLIPDAPAAKHRPRLVTKSYSLPLWRRRANSEDDGEQRVIKVALPSFSKKSTSQSRERNPSRSPPPPTSIPSCLRPPTALTPPTLSLTIPSTSSPIERGTLPPPPSPQPIRAPTPPPFTTILAVYTSAPISATVSTPHTAGLQPRTVPLRACCPECVSNTDAKEENFSRSAERVRRRGGESSLFAAARAGGFLSPLDDEEGRRLISGTGLVEVNRLVAALEERRSRSPSPCPSPSPTATGRASPSLLGAALGRAMEAGGEPYGELLSVDASDSGQGSSGRGSPLLSLGIAVDEVDKERRRRSADCRVIVLDEEDGYRYEQSPHISISTSPTRTSPTCRRPPSRPIAAYADDDDADLFPLPSASSSRAGTPATSPAGSDTSVHRLVNVKGSPRAAGLLPAALAGARAGSGSGTPYSREGVQEGMRCRSRSEAVCVALGSGPGRGRKEQQEEDGEDGWVEVESSDREKSLPIIPPLAVSVLAAGPYSPALAPRVTKQQASLAAAAAAGHGQGHLRVSSAPEATESVLTTSVSAPSTTTVPPKSTPAALSSSTPTSTPPPVQRSTSLQRTVSLGRTRSRSASDKDKDKGGNGKTGHGGHGAFGALVGVLKGVTSMSGPVAGAGVAV